MSFTRYTGWPSMSSRAGGLSDGMLEASGPWMTGFRWETLKMGAMRQCSRELQLIGDGIDLFEYFIWPKLSVIKFPTGLGLSEVFRGQPYSISWLVVGVFSSMSVALNLLGLGYLLESLVSAFPYLFASLNPIVYSQ